MIIKVICVCLCLTRVCVSDVPCTCVCVSDVPCRYQLPVTAQTKTGRKDAIATMDTRVHKDKKRKREEER